MGRLDNRIALITGSARGLGEGIALALASEGAAQYGVTVKAICPGTMVTEMMRTGFGEAAAMAGRDVNEMLKKADSIPLGRIGTAEDINRAAWIASDEACYTTGASFKFTGGEQVLF